MESWIDSSLKLDYRIIRSCLDCEAFNFLLQKALSAGFGNSRLEGIHFQVREALLFVYLILILFFFCISLEDDALPAMMNEILASVLSLKSNLNIDVMPIIEEIANYVVTDKLAATRNVRHQIYYIVDHIKDRRVVSLVRNSKYV